MVLLKNLDLEPMWLFNSAKPSGTHQCAVYCETGRGSFDYQVDDETEVAVLKWVDNKAATLASSWAGISPIKEVVCVCGKERTKVAVPCPNIVS